MSGCESDTEDWTLVTKEGEINTSQSSDSSLEFVNLDSETVTFSNRKSSERSVSPPDASTPAAGCSSLECGDNKNVLPNQTTAIEATDSSSSVDKVTTGKNIPTFVDKPSDISGLRQTLHESETDLSLLEGNKNSLETISSINETAPGSTTETNPENTQSSTDGLPTDGSTSTASSSFTNINDEQDSMTSSRSSFTALKPESDEDINQDLPPLVRSLVDNGATVKPLTVPADDSRDADNSGNRSDADSADSDFIRLEVCDSIDVDNTEMTSSSVSSRFSFMGRESCSPANLSPSSSCDAGAGPEEEEEEAEEEVGDDGVQINNLPDNYHGNLPVDDHIQNINNLPHDPIPDDDNNQQDDGFHGNDRLGDFHGNDNLREARVIEEFEEEREGNTESDIDDDQDARIESDQSDAGSTPPLDDDMSFVNDIGEIPLVAGDVARQYVHRPNCHLNLTLNVIAVLMIAVVVGLGIGHGIATLDEIEEYESIHEMMRKTILTCEKKRLEDRDVIEYLQKKNNLLEEKCEDSEKSLEKLRQQNQALFQKIDSNEDVQALRINLKNQINQLEIENEELKRSISQLKYTLHPPNVDSHSDKLLIGQTKSCDRSVPDKQTDQKRKLSDYSLDALELIHGVTSLDNSRLKQEVGRLRYTKHPGNSQTSVRDVSDMLSRKQESDDEGLVGEMRQKVRNGERRVMLGEIEELKQKQVDLNQKDTAPVAGSQDSTIPSQQEQEVDHNNKQHLPIPEHEKQSQTEWMTRTDREVVDDVDRDPSPWKMIATLENEIKDKNSQLLLWQQKYEDLLSQELVINSTTCLHYLLYNVSLIDWMSKIDSNMLNKFINSYSDVASDAHRSLADITVKILNRVSLTGSNIWNKFTDQRKEGGDDVETFVQDSNHAAEKQEILEERDQTSDTRQDHKDTNKPNYKDSKKRSQKSSDAENTTQNAKKKTPNEKRTEYLKDILNKTRNKMSNINQQIQETWFQVKNLSMNFWRKHEPAISRTLDTVSKKVSAIGERLHFKIMKKVKNWMRRDKKKKFRRQRYSESTEYNINKLKNKQRNHVETNPYPKKTHNSNKSLKNKPNNNHNRVHRKILNLLKMINKMKKQSVKNEKQREKKFETKSGKKLEKQLKRQKEREINQATKQFKKLNEKLRNFNQDFVESMNGADKKLVRDYLGNIHKKFGNSFNVGLRRALNCRVLFWEFVAEEKKKDIRFSSDSYCHGDVQFDYEARMFIDSLRGQMIEQTGCFNNPMEEQRNDDGYDDDEDDSNDDDNVCVVDDDDEDTDDDDDDDKSGTKGKETLRDSRTQQVPDNHHGNRKEDKPDWVFKRATHREDIRQHESQPDWIFDRARDRENVREQQSETDWVFDRANHRGDLRQMREELWDSAKTNDASRHRKRELRDIDEYSRQRHPVNMYSEDRWNDFEDEFDGYGNE